MKNKTIAEIYEEHRQTRERLLAIAEALVEADDENPAREVTAGEKWSVRHILEHLAKAEEGMVKVSKRLLEKAEAAAASENRTASGDGMLHLSENFREKSARAARENQKVTAPDLVQPEGAQTIRESIEKLKINREYLEKLRPKFETLDAGAQTFPHPAFGAMNAHDWLALIGGHEARHTRQIEEILASD